MGSSAHATYGMGLSESTPLQGPPKPSAVSPEYSQRMSVIGRTVSWSHLALQVATLASSSALPSAKKPLVVASRDRPAARAAAWANIAQWPGGSSVDGPSAQ